MVRMSKPEIETFFTITRTAVFATNSVNGHPQLTTVWFLYEDEAIYVGIERSSVKYRNLINDRRVTLCVDGEHPNGTTVVVYGLAEILSSETATEQNIPWRITRRYHNSDEEALQYLESIKHLESVILRINIRRMFGMDY